MIMQSLSYANRENVLSALSIFSTTTEIFGIVFAGLAVGIGVMVGSTLGANKTEEAKDTVKKLMWLGILISLIVGGLMIVLAPYIPLLWTEVASDQQQLASQMIIIYGAFLWIFSVCVSAYHTLRAGGMVFQTMILDSGLMWLATVPLAWALGLFTPLPLVYIYVLIQSVDIIKMIVGLYLVKKGSWANNLTKGLSNEEIVVAHI
jgi:Na+-driven multidrug efflux pump